MSGKKLGIIQRDRAALDLTVLHVEITRESHDLLRELAKAKFMSKAGYVDVMLKKKREKLIRLGFIQSDDSTLKP